MYQLSKKLFLKKLISLNKAYSQFRLEFSTRRYMKSLMNKKNLPKLSLEEIAKAKAFFRERGYKLKNTYWHQYYKGVNGEFHENYIPYDIFKPLIDAKLNNKKLWPALQDKNLSYKLFREFNQPRKIVQNINGFFFIADKLVSLEEALLECKRIKGQLIIKPTLETGRGDMVNVFEMAESKTSLNDSSLEDVFIWYGKDFVVQEFLEQSPQLKKMNPSSLNTIRVMSYLNNEGVQVLASVLRIGSLGSPTDNFSKGGLFCGIKADGWLKGKGYGPKDEVVTESPTGVELKTCQIPNYDQVLDMVKSMHHVVPHFRIISWDIGLNKENQPILIEYNTIGQGVDLQIANGPLFGEFTDEILALARATS